MKFLIQKLYINERVQIQFKKGENYILGKNGNDKTFLFNLMAYILGLRKSMDRWILNSSETIQPFIECQFGNKKIRISRAINSNEITFSGFFNKKVRIGTKELNDTYIDLLDLSFLSHYNETFALQILKLSFLNEDELSKSYLNKNNNYYKILGYNDEYLFSIKRDIEKLKSELKSEKEALDKVTLYNKSVKKSLTNLQTHDNTLEDVEEVLDEHLNYLKRKFTENNELLSDSKEFYRRERRKYEEHLEENIARLEPYFNNILKQLIPRNTIENLTLKDVIEKRNLGTSSIMERVIILFALHLTFCRNTVENGIGLLINDSLFSVFDYKTLQKIRNKVSEVSSDEQIQYIEFCNEEFYVPNKKDIVFEIPSRIGGGFFG
ncbi:UNVERIFIED_CONTAM: hypothetical protein N8J90_06125 [Halobacillus marinus]